MIVLYILLAILVFGFLILVHELGHFLFAKLFKVKINEFSIGMGPKLFSKKGKDEVEYNLRLLPIGGYVAMEGESETSENPNAFNKKPVWQRLIIVVAGALVNILVGSIIMTCITVSEPYYGTTIIHDFKETAVSDDYGLQKGDKIIKIGSEKVHTYDELSYEIMRSGYKPVSVTVLRDGKEVKLEKVMFEQTSQEGITFGSIDFIVKGEKKTVPSVMKNSLFSIKNSIKMIGDSLFDLLSGRYGVDQISGPIGVTGAITDAAKFGPRAFFYMVVIISMNLGVFNLLPIPALDGGAIVFLIIELIRKKPLPQKVEAIIKTVFMALLLLLVFAITVKDIFTLFV